MRANMFFGSKRGNIRAGLFFVAVGVLCAIMAFTTDKAAALFLRNTLSKEVREAFLPVTELGKADFYLAALVLLWLAGRIGFVRAAPLAVARVWADMARTATFILSSLALSAVLVHVLKLTIGRARPKMLFREDIYAAFPFAFDTSLSSFPSGHSQTVWSIMAALMFLYPRAWPLFAAWATLVASSRVIVGAHFPSDILMGAFIGAMTALYVRQKWYADLKAPTFKPFLKHGERRS